MLVLANFIFTELGSLFNSYVELTLIYFFVATNIDKDGLMLFGKREDYSQIIFNAEAP
jgi:hypothetical protein